MYKARAHGHDEGVVVVLCVGGSAVGSGAWRRSASRDCGSAGGGTTLRFFWGGQRHSGRAVFNGLVAVGGWRLVAVGGWRLAVGGP